jgi:hypothetical protein
MGSSEISTPSADEDVTGLLIIRAWTERGSSAPLRAQVRFTADVGTGFDRLVTFCQPEAVTGLVSAWLKEVTGPHPRRTGGHAA